MNVEDFGGKMNNQAKIYDMDINEKLLCLKCAKTIL
jgi:hypothetical protein